MPDTARMPDTDPGPDRQPASRIPDTVLPAGRLTRAPARPAQAVTLWDGAVALAAGRVHEICGRARRRLALQVGAAAGAPVLWIAPPRATLALNTAGMAGLIAPQHLIFASPDRPVDSLWTMEEALRSGAVAAVVADLEDPPGMTAVRRLHLAAQAGMEAGHRRPIGLILTPGNGGAPGVETRWRQDPAHRDGRDGWHLARLRARMAPQAAWRVTGRTLAAIPADTDAPA